MSDVMHVAFSKFTASVSDPIFSGPFLESRKKSNCKARLIIVIHQNDRYKFTFFVRFPPNNMGYNDEELSDYSSDFTTMNPNFSPCVIRQTLSQCLPLTKVKFLPNFLNAPKPDLFFP